MGDRICPTCNTESLVEKGNGKWKCLNPECQKEFTDEELDADTEVWCDDCEKYIEDCDC